MILSDKEEEGEEEEEGDISVRKLGGRYRMGWVGSDSEEMWWCAECKLVLSILTEI